mgnify:CR=1 FL=1
MITIDESQCTGCKLRLDTTIFKLCCHEKSKYEIAGKVDFHTRVHMIRIQGGSCVIKEI